MYEICRWRGEDEVNAPQSISTHNLRRNCFVVVVVVVVAIVAIYSMQLK